MAGKLSAAVLLGLGQLALGSPDGANQWAVIAAGSAGFGNYRHQADACHAYHVMLKNGVPADNIILMMEDDVAKAPENPFPGKLFNKPGNNVTDVYAGCVVDYAGAGVTADLFIKVITGDATNLPKGSGKVLKSGSSDRVFLNFVDHGGPGIVAFPNGPFLHASDLGSALQKMQTNKMFGELLFYMEACESGSMFPNLKTDSKVFAVTASNAQESSWGTYCGADALVDGKNVGSCLGDLFSIAWMEDTDLGPGSETIQEQLARVTKRTNLSHVSSFGDTTFGDEPVSNFVKRSVQIADERPFAVGSEAASWDVRDIPLHQAYFKWAAASGAAKQAAWTELQTVVTDRAADEATFNEVAKRACKGSGLYGCNTGIKENRHTMKDAECHKVLARTVYDSCPRRGERSPGGWNTFNMKYSQLLVNMCEQRTTLKKDMQQLIDIVHGECVTATVQFHQPSGPEQVSLIV